MGQCCQWEPGTLHRRWSPHSQNPNLQHVKKTPLPVHSQWNQNKAESKLFTSWEKSSIKANHNEPKKVLYLSSQFLQLLCICFIITFIVVIKFLVPVPIIISPRIQLFIIILYFLNLCRLWNVSTLRKGRIQLFSTCLNMSYRKRKHSKQTIGATFTPVILNNYIYYELEPWEISRRKLKWFRWGACAYYPRKTNLHADLCMLLEAWEGPGTPGLNLLVIQVAWLLLALSTRMPNLICTPSCHAPCNKQNSV